MEVPAEKTKTAPSNDGFIKIQLGKIGDVARVLVNGKQYGYAWTAPYEVYVPKRDLKNGSNEIQIVVANTWHNALQGAGEGKAPFKGIGPMPNIAPRARRFCLPDYSPRLTSCISL